MGLARLSVVVGLLASGWGCGRVSYVELDAGRDAGGMALDAAVDSGADAAVTPDAAMALDAEIASDAGTDAGSSPDAGPMCFMPTVPSCDYTCVIAPGMTSSCMGPVSFMLAPGPPVPGAVAVLDMNGFTTLRIVLETCDPVGILLNLGDSPTNNCGGGDSGSSSNDSELQIQDTTFSLFANDYGPPMGIGPLVTMAPLLTTGACETRTIVVQDGLVAVCEAGVSIRNDVLLRINPSMDMEGPPDALWYLGVNRSVLDPSRSGTGVVQATLCFAR